MKPVIKVCDSYVSRIDGKTKRIWKCVMPGIKKNGFPVEAFGSSASDALKTFQIMYGE
jgi:hypothetical protein